MDNNQQNKPHTIIVLVLFLTMIIWMLSWIIAGYPEIGIIGELILLVIVLLCLNPPAHEVTEFPPQSSKLPRNTIHSEFFSKNIDRMTGIEFEHYCGQLLILLGYKQVLFTKVNGDHGADIIANRGDFKYAIQCKCYKSNVGVDAVREALSAQKYYQTDYAVVMTNSFFTRQAKSESERLEVALWDRKALEKMKKTAQHAALETPHKANGSANHKIAEDQATIPAAYKVPLQTQINTPTSKEISALITAKSYLSCMAFSRRKLFGQLKFEGFTSQEAAYATDNCGANWFAEADKCAKLYMAAIPYTRQGLIEQLIFEGFTQQQAEYGANVNCF